MRELAERIEGAAEADPETLARRGVELMLEAIGRRSSASACTWTASPPSARCTRAAPSSAPSPSSTSVYPHEGAAWLRTTVHGDDKDRVLRRSSGEITYFGSDIAYHQDKLERGYDRAIDVWGADHHGYIQRVRAAWEALGGDPERFEIVIMQLVNLSEGGQRAQMSKRAGSLVTLDDLLDDIGVDAARWFLVQRSHDTTLDLDLDLARRESQDNPVYYVQYAHARIASILRKAGEERVQAALAADLAASAEQFHPSARALVKQLLEFPQEVRDAAERRAPHRMTTYAHETAQGFSAFYRDCRVVGAAEEGGDEDVRIVTCFVTMRVLARTLDLLGVSAPEEM